MSILIFLSGVFVGMCFAFSERYSQRAQAFYNSVVDRVQSLAEKVRK